MRVTVALLLGVLLVPSAAGASLTGDGDGALDTENGAITTEIWVTNDGTITEPTGAGGTSSSSPRVFRYVYEPLPTWSTEQGGPFCDAGDGRPGWKFKVTTMSGTLLVGEPTYTCVPFPDPDDQTSPPAPPPLPEPPTVAEIWHAVATTALPRPDIGVSPITDGVTGLETWLWITNDTEPTVNVTATVGAWSVTGTATRTGYTFDFGDGARSRRASTTGGSEADPPARHTYETKGPYVLQVASTWTATFALTGPSVITPIPVDTGTLAVTTTRDYRVVEIRGVLVG